MNPNGGWTFEPTVYDGNTYWMAIPEPGTVGLALGGLALVLLRRRRG